MTRAICVSVIAAAALLGACNDDDNDDLIIGGNGENLEWTADIFGVGDFARVTGTADMTFVTGEFQFGVTATINGDVAGAVRGWEVATGTCASGGDIIGISSDFMPFVTDSSGSDTVSVIVPESLDPNGVFHINVFAGTSGTDFTTIIACGDFVPLF